jgi:chemotaxis protein MotB
VSRDSSESGVLVYPKMPVPKGQRESKPRFSGGGNANVKIVGAIVGAIIAGGVVGFLVRPAVSPDKRVAALADQVAEAEKGEGNAKDKADALAKEVAAAKTAQAAAEQKLKESQDKEAVLAGKAADAEKKIKDSEAIEAKFKAALDKNGSVTTEGDEIHLQLLDRVLFNVNDDQLTAPGKKVIDKVAAALKDLADKQVFVQGHTDDQPIFNPPPKVKPKPGTPPVPVRFATNWELSAARALNVVHYLQDVAKIDPTRLAALAFGQYRPVSRSNKAANRRIEIVLYPKRTILKK